MASLPVSISRFPVFDRDNLPRRGQDYNNGALFLIDKPAGWSSFDVVKFLRNRIRARKTGHAGTLDPQATGLLVLCAGKATKGISEIQEHPKRYLGTVTFGSSTPSQDAATQPEERASWDHLDRKMIEDMLANRFTGTIRQIPPMYSALWKDGKRLYNYARKGETVEREPREVTIHEIEVVSYQDGKLQLNVLCGKGTYIRTLAHDLGIVLGTRAHLSELRRTEIGPYHVDKAVTIDLIRHIYPPGA